MRICRLLVITLCLFCLDSNSHADAETKNYASYAVKNTGERNLRLEIWKIKNRSDVKAMFYAYEVTKYHVDAKNTATEYSKELTIDTVRTVEIPLEEIFEKYSFVDIPFELGNGGENIGHIERRKSKSGSVLSTNPIFSYAKQKGSMTIMTSEEYRVDGGKMITTETYLAEEHYFPYLKVIDLYDYDGSFRGRTIWEKLK